MCVCVYMCAYVCVCVCVCVCAANLWMDGEGVDGEDFALRPVAFERKRLQPRYDAPMRSERKDAGVRQTQTHTHSQRSRGREVERERESERARERESV